MVQIYLLSIVSNILISMGVLSERTNEKMPVVQDFRGFLDKYKPSRLSLGLVAAITGILQFITVTAGDVVVVGDLLPAVTGIFLGAVGITGHYKSRSEIVPKFMDKLDRLTKDYSSLIGYGGILVSVLHFLMPGVLFL